MNNFWNNKKVYVTGASGFVGKAVCNLLDKRNCIIVKGYSPKQGGLDLRNFEVVDEFINENSFDAIIHLAGKVGGIAANNSQPASFFWDNITIGTNVLHAAYKSNVSKVVSLAAGCGYPLGLEVPYREDDFWYGLPQEESMSYSMAKKMLIIQSLAYKKENGFTSVVLLPANLYGPEDNFDLETSHVVPALVRKFIEAKQEGFDWVQAWGDGKSTREFLYVEDCARAILDAVEFGNDVGPYNLGTGVETSIRELVHTIAELVEFEGNIVWDADRPNGQSRRFYDMSKFKQAFGYVPETTLKDGLMKTIRWYLDNKSHKVCPEDGTGCK